MYPKRISLILALIISVCTFGQDKPFWPEIQAFKKQDSIQFPPKKAILFVGSSSFRMWKNAQSDFPKHIIINRGFGGSGLPHVIEYADQIIFPYKPKQVVIYCGENDFFQADNVTPQIVTERFMKLFSMIRKKLPKAYIAFVSFKPSPRRQEWMQKYVETNNLVREFLRTQKRTDYIDIYNEMLDADGNPRKELFIEDNLHMNSAGYKIWQRAFEPKLKRTKRPKT
jgi:lysophospholipase L1-like esterase